MNITAERLRKAFWRYKQPLTLLPAVAGAAVSDLFLWRNSADWETFFELTDLTGLFEGAAPRSATLSFFDACGNLFLTRDVTLRPDCRKTLALRDFVAGHGESGTFAVFHSHTPTAVAALGSYLSERGYVSYRYRQAPLRSYVHGNLDAIALLPGGGLQLLGGGGLAPRQYALQHALRADTRYELAIVNPTAASRRLVCSWLCRLGGVLHSESVRLPPRGAHIFSAPSLPEESRAVFSSRLVMARPLVFRLRGEQADALHG